MSPSISKHYQQREPSAIRKAQILFNSRKDKKNIEVITQTFPLENANDALKKLKNSEIEARAVLIP